MLAGRFACVVDACVLHTPLYKAVILEFASSGLFRLVLSETILDEWRRSLETRFGDAPEKAAAPVETVRLAFAGAIVDLPAGLVDGIALPDADDRHVVAAALVGKASAIVTANLRDFPEEACAPYGLDVIHPDTFIVNIIDLDETRAAAAIRNVRDRWKKPAYTAQQVIDAFAAKGMVQTAQRLRHIADLI